MSVYSLEIKGEGIEVIKHIDDEILRRIINIILTYEATGS